MDYLEPMYYHIKKARQLEYIMQYEYSIYYYNLALRKVEELYNERKDKFPVYQALLAPFYFKLGYSLASYVELNTDKDDNLKELVIPKHPWKNDKKENQEKLLVKAGNQEDTPEKTD